MYSLRTIAQPTVEPVDLDTFRSHLRVDGTDEDDLLMIYLRGARSSLEQTTQRAFMPQTLEFGIDRFPFNGYGWRNASQSATASSSVPGWIDRSTIRLPKPACLAVQAITYLDGNGAPQTLNPSGYILDSASEPARIIPSSNFYWPLDEFFMPGTVRLTYLAGSYALPVTETLVVAAGTSGQPGTLTLSQTFAGGPFALSTVSGSTVAPVAATISAANVMTIADATPVGTAVTVTYYGTIVPPHVEAAILLLGAHMYKNREAASDVLMTAIPMGVQSLIAPEIFYAGAFEQ